MPNAKVPYQPSFLLQPGVRELPPLLVTEGDAAKLLALGRAEIKQLVAEGVLCAVEIHGVQRLTVASLVQYVADLMVERRSMAVDSSAAIAEP
jgi:hypothetical protein